MSNSPSAKFKPYLHPTDLFVITRLLVPHRKLQTLCSNTHVLHNQIQCSRSTGCTCRGRWLMMGGRCFELLELANCHGSAVAPDTNTFLTSAFRFRSCINLGPGPGNVGNLAYPVVGCSRQLSLHLTYIPSTQRSKLIEETLHHFLLINLSFRLGYACPYCGNRGSIGRYLDRVAQQLDREQTVIIHSICGYQVEYLITMWLTTNRVWLLFSKSFVRCEVGRQSSRE